MKLSVKTREVDEELLMRVLEIKVGDKKANTPSKSANGYVNVGDINEVHKGITLEKIKSINEDNKVERSFNREISKQLMDKSINIVFLRFNDVKIPDEVSMETIVDLQYHHTDALVVPSIPKIVKEYTGEKLLDKILSFADLYVETVEKMNNKTIIGTFPSKIPRQYIPNIMQYYHSKNITSFVIDTDGGSLYSNLSWLNSFKREIKKLEIEDEGLIYNLNPNPGKFMKKEAVLAKDFIMLPFGIDVVGNNHVAPSMPSDVWDSYLSKMRKGPRRFYPSEYSYRRVEEKNLNSIDIKNKNVITQYKETLVIQEVIKENNTAKAYIETKPQVKQENVMKNINILKRKITKPIQTHLF